ncbi:MAG: HesA/MoeB/ThiF family protein [Candidatus Bathyarchaeota archaeon]|nr:HesA/MoeB/ThiF family protein [Candidatus Bathyarchaeota archaeon]
MSTIDKEFSDKEIEYYSRQIVLKDIGYAGQLKLKNAKVCVVGLGGLGCPIATQLTAMGVGYLWLIDRDVIELSNLQRQHLYGPKFVGYPKVEVAAKRLEELNPYIDIEPLPISLNERNAEKFLKGMDVVIDGLDRMDVRYAVNRACIKLKIPYIFGAAITTFGSTSTIIPNKTPCLECFYGNINDEKLPKCSTVGVHPSVIATIASIEVAEAIRIILGQKPKLMNKLFYCDIESLAFDELNISRIESCPVCGRKTKGTLFSIKHELIEEICGRGGKRSFMIVPKENLDLPLKRLIRFLADNELKIKIKAKLGITFKFDDRITASLLKSGVAIIEGVDNKNKALDLYEKVVINGLGIQQSQIR